MQTVRTLLPTALTARCTNIVPAGLRSHQKYLVISSYEVVDLRRIPAVVYFGGRSFDRAKVLQMTLAQGSGSLQGSRELGTRHWGSDRTNETGYATSLVTSSKPTSVEVLNSIDGRASRKENTTELFADTRAFSKPWQIFLLALVFMRAPLFINQVADRPAD